VGDKIFSLNNSLTGNQHLPDNRVRNIIKTEKGEIWIGTYQGIVVLDKNSASLISNNGSNGLPQNSIYVLHKGKNDGIWVGTWAGGIAYYRNCNYRFNHIAKVPLEQKTKSVISAIVEDKNKNIWIGSEQAGINIYNAEKEQFEDINFFDQKNLIRIKSLTRIEIDKIIIGTFYQGLWVFDEQTHGLYKISNENLPDASIISTLTGVKNEIWLGTRGAKHSLFNYNLSEKKFQFFDIASTIDTTLNSLRVWNLLLDSSLKLWACTDEGLYFKNKNDSVFNKCFNNDSIYGLNNTMIYTIYEDKDEILWIGTKGKGLFQYNPANKTLFHVDNNPMLKGIDICGITEDKYDNVWVSSNNGIFYINPSQNTTTRYTSVDGLPGEQFTPNSILSSSRGEIFFGSSNGFCFINPEDIKINSIKPDLFLTNLLINNNPYSKAEKFEANSSIVEEIKTVKLQHHQNSLTFGVAANNFLKPEKNQFKYRMLNYQENWIETGPNKDITFTKIPPGNYTLEIIGSNNDNIWNEKPLRIEIEIEYPLWQKWYAVIFYFLFIFLISYLVIKETRIRLKLRKEILAERYKSEAQEHLYAEKMRFFTNVSHEIRTPLTLVISPLNNLLNKFKYDVKTSEQLLTIKRNSQRLLRLTNQILDFRLLEVNKLKAHYQKSDIVKISSDIVNCFEPMIKEKQINFIFSSNYKELYIDVDPDMIEKIIYNLVSNALKFSFEKGQVFLSIESKELNENNYNNFVSAGSKFIGPSVEIKVRDFGKGIPENLLPEVFERFTTMPGENHIGAGIGLHLCQEYTKLHKGNILVKSKEDKGSTFILNIPFAKNSTYEKKTILKQLVFENDSLSENFTPEEAKIKGNKKIVLLVEDNDDLRNYLKNYLSAYFKIITAKNGQQAIEIAKEVIPHIIITDILMPQSDGFELTQNLKSDPKTNQIPIIILTALSESKYQKESLLNGVDSYLTKPVDETVLLAQIENILNNRELVRKRISLENENVNLKEETERNGSLTERVEKIISKNLRNSNFEITDLLDELNVSRSTFHRKIKVMSNQSPSEFIRDIRLQHAVKMIKTGKYNIDEIGTYVGFNSTSYFIRSFKKKYGKTPKEYYSGFKQTSNIS
jgi:signal transduction histidine kinase/DNA-binding response OmpR family regulator